MMDTTLKNINIPQTTNLKLNYDKSVVPIYVIGDYGIAPWGKNTYFPDLTAKWIWYTLKSNIESPNNSSSPITIQYIYTNNSNIEINSNLNVIVDSYCEILLNSKQLKKIDGSLGATDGWKQGANTWNIFPFTIQPGDNLFEFIVSNSGGPGGLIVSCTMIDSEKTNNKVLFHTDGDWKFIPLSYKPISSCNLSQAGLITTIDKSFPWGSLSLNGVSQYVNIGKTITGMNGLSLGCWFKLNNNKNNARIIDFANNSNTDNIIMSIVSNSISIKVYLGSNLYNEIPPLSVNINDNKWHHIIWTMQPTINGATHCIYLDNNNILISNGIYPSNIERTNCYLAKSNFLLDPYFSGSISNFVMYQKVLSIEEIKALYLSMINLKDPTLYLYLPFSTNSVLDTLLNNYAGKTFSLPITKSMTPNENWTCLEQNKKWISVKMNNDNVPICMSMDGKNCVETSLDDCNKIISNPIVPQNPIVCTETNIQTKTGFEWCTGAKQLLMANKSTNSSPPLSSIKSSFDTHDVSHSTVDDNILNTSLVMNEGKTLSLGNMTDVNNLMIGGTFKLKVNLPNMPPYIKGQNFDINKGINPNYFYLSIEKLDDNCNIKSLNNKCFPAFADNKNCNIKSLTSYTKSNKFRLVLVSSQYVLDPSIPIGKNSDFTLVNINNQIYLKNIQTGYLPSLYSNDLTVSVYGDMEVKSNSNVGGIYSQLNNTLCSQEIPPIQTTGTSFVKCDIKQDSGLYLMTTKNIGSSSPIRVNINSDKTISLNLLSFNIYGYPTKVYALSYCNFNIQTYAYIEKITNTLGTFMINLVCFEDTANNNANPKNQLKFTVELINFPTNFVKNNSVFSV